MTESETLREYAARAAPVCGWPEWMDTKRMETRPWWYKHRLRIWTPPNKFPETLWHIEFEASTGLWAAVGDLLTDREALCLWREHCREWLRRRGWVGHAGLDEDYDQWLIAAVEAAGKEKR